MTFAGRIEAQMTVPSAIAVSATNNGGGPTTVTLTPGTYYPSALLAQLAADLNTTRPPLNYPLTAVATATAYGAGTWLTAYFCDDASGNATAQYGSPSLVQNGVPTYGNAGPRAGTDKAFGFATSNGGFVASSTATFEVGTNDFCFVHVVKFSGIANASSTVRLCAKNTFGGGDPGYELAYAQASGLYVNIYRTGGTLDAQAIIPPASIPSGEYLVIVAVLDRSTNKLRLGIQSLSTGIQVLTTLSSTTPGADLTSAGAFQFGCSCTNGASALAAAMYVAIASGAATGIAANLGTFLSNVANAVNAGWTATLSTGSSGTGKVTIGCVQAPSTATFALAWTSTALRDIVGFISDIAATAGPVSGSKQCRGLFIPDAPLFADSDPKRAPLGSDERTTVSPSGDTYGFVGVPFYRHRNVYYTGVTRARAWEAEATIANSSWEFFYKETQLGLNSSWFTPKRKCQIYFDNLGTDTLVGIDANSGAGVAGWGIPKPVTLDEFERVIPDYVGLLTLRLGDLFSSG